MRRIFVCNSVSGYRGNLRELLANPQIQRAFLLLDDTELCYDVAKLSLGRSALLDAAFERATLYRTRLKRLKEINQPGYSYWYECTSRHLLWLSRRSAWRINSKS